MFLCYQKIFSQSPSPPDLLSFMPLATLNLSARGLARPPLHFPFPQTPLTPLFPLWAQISRPLFGAPSRLAFSRRGFFLSFPEHLYDECLLNPSPSLRCPFLPEAFPLPAAPSALNTPSRRSQIFLNAQVPPPRTSPPPVPFAFLLQIFSFTDQQLPQGCSLLR